MPLAKHKSSKLKHILCDVFLLVVLQTAFVTAFPGKSHDLDALTEGGPGNTIPYNVIESILRDQDAPNYNSEVVNNLRSLRRKRSIETSTNAAAATSPEDENNEVSFTSSTVTTTTSPTIITTAGSQRVLLNKITNSLKMAKPDDKAKNLDVSLTTTSQPNNLREIYINSTVKSDVKVSLNSTNKNTVNLTITMTPTDEMFKELSLRNKSIRSLTEICGNISASSTLPSGLEVFDLSENHIVKYDGSSSCNNRLKNVKRLNLSRNHLSGIYKDTFSGLFNLNTLILSHNNISFIDYDGFMRLSNMEYLDLSFNQLDGNSTRSLQNIPDLVGLSIAYNEGLGESLQEFVTSWSLQQFDASGTGLCKIPAALAQSVKALKLKDNWLQVSWFCFPYFYGWDFSVVGNLLGKKQLFLDGFGVSFC